MSTVDLIDELKDETSELYNLLDNVINGMSEYVPRRVGNRLPSRSFSGLNGETKESQQEFLQEYERWFATGEELVKEYLPNRLEEFRNEHDLVVKLIKFQHSPDDLRLAETGERIADSINTQRRILDIVPAKIRARKHKLHESISKQVSKDEIEQARKLLDEGLVRASGVVAGVALERHLLTQCEQSDEDLNVSHDDGIHVLSKNLYEAGEIDKTTFKRLDALGSVRNDCAHANQKEPNEHRIRNLIEDTDDYIRGRGL